MTPAPPQDCSVSTDLFPPSTLFQSSCRLWGAFSPAAPTVHSGPDLFALIGACAFRGRPQYHEPLPPPLPGQPLALSPPAHPPNTQSLRARRLRSLKTRVLNGLRPISCRTAFFSPSVLTPREFCVEAASGCDHPSDLILRPSRPATKGYHSAFGLWHVPLRRLAPSTGS